MLRVIWLSASPFSFNYTKVCLFYACLSPCVCFFFLHANRCMFLSICMPCLLYTHTHTHKTMNVGIKIKWPQVQIIRRGEEGQEDLVGGEWRGGEEEGSRKETFLWGVEAQETHCSWRHEGVQVKINRSQMVNSVMMADDPSSHCASSPSFPR